MADINDVLQALGEVRGDLKAMAETVTAIKTRMEGWDQRCADKHRQVEQNQQRVEKQLNQLPERVVRLEDTVHTWKWYVRVTWGAILGTVVAAVIAAWKTLTEGR